MTIRAARAADAAALSPLFEELGYPTDAAEIERRLRELNADAVVLLSQEADAVTGFVVVEVGNDVIGGFSATIGGLIVKDGFRSRGIGEQLLAAAEAWVFERGAQRIVVRSNVVRERAHGFYERAGYSRSKTQHVFVKCYATAKRSANPSMQ